MMPCLSWEDSAYMAARDMEATATASVPEVSEGVHLVNLLTMDGPAALSRMME